MGFEKGIQAVLAFTKTAASKLKVGERKRTPPYRRVITVG
jgi:hypothetical protein